MKGEPVPDVRVQLLPIENKNKAGLVAWGVTDSNGKFNVKSPGGSGAAAGSYKLVLSEEGPKSEEEAAAKSSDRAEKAKRIQEAAKKMASAGKSGPDNAKIEAMKRASMSGADPSQLEAIRRDIASGASQTPMDRAIADNSLPFPAEYSSVITTPKEVEVVNTAVTLELDL